MPPRFLPFLLFAFLPAAAFAQFDKANDLFQEKRYAAATPLFEKGLQEKPSLVAQSRLAFCYRMLNQMDKAEALYASIVTHERARSETFLFYAESLMSNGKYAEAKEWFLNYHKMEPDDSTALRRAAACDLVPNIQPYFPAAQIEEFSQNSEADDNTPAFFPGGLVFTSDRSNGWALLKEKSGWTGRDFLNLWFAPFDTATGKFGDVQNFSRNLNELNKNTANASFSADYKTVVFSRNNENTNKRGEVTMQLYTAERSKSGWKNEHKLEFCQPELNYMHPALSPDGQRLFYASNAGGRGGFDIFSAEKKKDGAWGRVQNLGQVVNTSAHEAFPFFDRHGRLFFASKGHAGFGGFDIFMTKMDSASGTWAVPLNLGRPINSSLDDLGFCLSQNDSLGAFTSGRSGGDDDVFLFWLGQTNPLRGFFFPKTNLQVVENVAVDSVLAKVETTAPVRPVAYSTEQSVAQTTTQPAVQPDSIFQKIEPAPAVQPKLPSEQIQVAPAGNAQPETPSQPIKNHQSSIINLKSKTHPPFAIQPLHQSPCASFFSSPCLLSFPPKPSSSPSPEKEN